MKTSEYVLLALHACGDSISGRTLLQKTIYFMGIMTGDIGDLGYRAHYYGPYSDEVACAVRDLEGLLFVESRRTRLGYDQEGFEITLTDYKLTNDGRQIAEMKRTSYPELWRRLQNAAEVIREGQQKGYVFLSIAAKTYFMLFQQQEPATHERLAEIARDFGWEVTPEQVQKAARYLASLRLVEIQAA